MTMTNSPSALLDKLLTTKLEESSAPSEADTSQLSEEAKQSAKRKLIRQISYSSLNEFRACERRYYLDKLTTSERDSTIDTAFGAAVGAGVQTLWLTGDFDKARGATFFAWNVGFADERTDKKKSIAYALKAVEAFFPFYEILSHEWELAIFNGVPAIEYSLRVEMPGGFIYRAFVDFILRHKETGVFCICELKTTGATWIHEAQYKNSDQGTAYALMLDQLVGVEGANASFWVKYFAFFSTKQEWVPFDFPKALINKVRWLRTSLRDVKDIERCEREDYWPMRGAACMNFGRPCRYFENCGLQDRALLAPAEEWQKKVEKEEQKVYSFSIPLEKVVEGYLS